MSDASVFDALRSTNALVVVEAPAGAGKTHKGAEYALDAVSSIGEARVLILAHTHAAVDVFASRTKASAKSVDIRTIDSLICEIAAAYHSVLDLPSDVAEWARREERGYETVAGRVVALLTRYPSIVRGLAARYPIVICDEHQDAGPNQNALAMAYHAAGSRLRVFGDPMQRIYRSKQKDDALKECQLWDELQKKADVFDKLDEPHRWLPESAALGQWLLAARETLKSGGKISLKGPLPPGLHVVYGDNRSKQRGVFALSREARRPIDQFVAGSESLLVLARQNDTVQALRSFFGRRLPIWEGHTRDATDVYVDGMAKAGGDAAGVGAVAIGFLQNVAVGFSDSQYGKTVLGEIRGGCQTKRRGKPVTLQRLAKILCDEPDFKGAARFLSEIAKLIGSDPQFSDIHIDNRREFWEVVRLGDFDDLFVGYRETSRRRTYARIQPPPKAVSTIHKAKGLECRDVLIVPCDRATFSSTDRSRCLLYVAMSRATHSLMLVLSGEHPSPLIEV
jgi:hypothetical protein